MDRIFNETKFFEEAEKIHLTFDESWAYSFIPDAEVRQRLDEILDYDPIFAPVLDRICLSVVGRTLFRFLSTKTKMRRKGEKIRLINQRNGEDSYYSRPDFAVITTRELFDENWVIQDGSMHYCLNEKGEIDTKEMTLADILFHEFCHALHDIESNGEILQAGELHRSNPILGEVWSNAEELRTITGCIYGVSYDPVCDHCFDVCECCIQKKEFFPRYSHYGFSPEASPLDEDMRRRKLLSYYPESENVMVGWKNFLL